MAERFLFFNSTPDDRRKYQAQDFADYFGSVLSTGLLHTDNMPGMKVSVETGTLNTIVSPGKAIMRGHLYENTEPLKLAHAIPEPTLDRIDRIVLRLDLNNAVRNIKLHVKTGVSAASPVAPVLQRDQFVHEISLAQIRVRKNTSQLQAVDLVDERLNQSLCGLVYSLISIPTDQLQNFILAKMDVMNEESAEFSRQLAQMLIDYQNEWSTWFNDIKTRLPNEAKLVSIEDSANKFTATNVEDALLELFQFADSGRSELVPVIGPPASAANTFSQLKTHIQNAKNKGAANLTAKGTTATASESLDSLMSKIATVKTGYSAGDIVPKNKFISIIVDRTIPTGYTNNPSFKNFREDTGISYYSYHWHTTRPYIIMIDRNGTRAQVVPSVYMNGDYIQYCIDMPNGNIAYYTTPYNPGTGVYIRVVNRSGTVLSAYTLSGTYSSDSFQGLDNYGNNDIYVIYNRILRRISGDTDVFQVNVATSPSSAALKAHAGGAYIATQNSVRNYSRSGELLWNTTVDMPQMNSLGRVFVDGSFIYVVDRNGRMVRLNSSGSIISYSDQPRNAPVGRVAMDEYQNRIIRSGVFGSDSIFQWVNQMGDVIQDALVPFPVPFSNIDTHYDSVTKEYVLHSSYAEIYRFKIDTKII